jgi:microsomal dipeptidase-like Zn-dependent dipeptidase
MDVFLHVTRNGGATMEILETAYDKHSDNHALWVDPANGRHMLVGTDAGVYESFDEGRTWRHFPNLTKVLVRRGYSEESIQKVLGENFLRVYKAVLGD